VRPVKDPFCRREGGGFGGINNACPCGFKIGRLLKGLEARRGVGSFPPGLLVFGRPRAVVFILIDICQINVATNLDVVCVMKYFKSDDEMWRFPEAGAPQIRTPAQSRWVEGTVMNLEEFLRVNPDAVEVTAGEAEGFAVTAEGGVKRCGKRLLLGRSRLPR
jgi:hypothetical protein